MLNLQPGDQVTAHGPHGKFTLKRDQTPAVLIAGGIGVTPCRSMLLTSEGGSNDKRLTLAYIQRESQFVFVPELKEAAQDEKNQVHFLTTDAELTSILDGSVGSEVDYYVSGLPAMVKGVGEQLDGLGVPRKRIHRNSFTGY